MFTIVYINMGGIWLVLSGLIFFTGCYIFLLSFLSRRYAKSLTTADQYLIAEKCISSLQASLSMIVGAIVVYNCQQEIMTHQHWLTNTYALFGYPYFVYDIFAIYNTHYYLNEDIMRTASVARKLRHFAKNNAMMLVHHMLLPFIFFPTILVFRGGKGDYFVGIFYTIEAAIPFISLRFILAQLNLKHSIAYIVSGLLMIFVFFLVRIGVFPFLYWQYSKYSGIPFLQVPFAIPIKCNLGCLVVISVQVYFLWLMVRGAYRFFAKAYKRRQSKYA